MARKGKGEMPAGILLANILTTTKVTFPLLPSYGLAPHSPSRARLRASLLPVPIGIRGRAGFSFKFPLLAEIPPVLLPSLLLFFVGLRMRTLRARKVSLGRWTLICFPCRKEERKSEGNERQYRRPPLFFPVFMMALIHSNTSKVHYVMLHRPSG